MLSPPGLMVLWLACVMASADDTACALQKALGKPNIRDNYRCVYLLVDGKGLRAMKFNEASHSITQGQPYEGVFTLGFYLDVRAGPSWIRRSGTRVQCWLTPGNALVLYTWEGETGDPLPSERSFAVFAEHRKRQS